MLFKTHLRLFRIGCLGITKLDESIVNTATGQSYLISKLKPF